MARKKLGKDKSEPQSTLYYFYTQERWDNWLKTLEEMDFEGDPESEEMPEGLQSLGNFTQDINVSVLKIMKLFLKGNYGAETALGKLNEVEEIVLGSLLARIVWLELGVDYGDEPFPDVVHIVELGGVDDSESLRQRTDMQRVVDPYGEAVVIPRVVEGGPEEPAPEVVIDRGRFRLQDAVPELSEVAGPAPRGDGHEGAVLDLQFAWRVVVLLFNHCTVPLARFCLRLLVVFG